MFAVNMLGAPVRGHIPSPVDTLIPDTTERAMSPEALQLERELDQLHPAAFGWALACCAGDRAAAEDALQASYLKILDGRARFDGRASFRTWLFSVVRYTAAGQRRRAVLRRWLPLAFVAATPDGRPDAVTPHAGARRRRDRARRRRPRAALGPARGADRSRDGPVENAHRRSEEHTSELQSR